MPSQPIEALAVKAPEVAPAVTEIPVPLDALSQPNEQEQMEAPEQGDSGTMQVEFTVSRIEGETAFIRPTAINGKPIEGSAQEEATETPGQEQGEQATSPDEAEASLRAALSQANG